MTATTPSDGYRSLTTAGHDSIVLVRKIQSVLTDGTTLDQAIHLTVKDRTQLAEAVMEVADELHSRGVASSKESFFRSAVSRHYYGAYHYCRAVSFFVIQGDDKDGHASLANALPKDFPDRVSARNDFLNLRLFRNEADYEQYVPLSPTWESRSTEAQTLATNFTQAARQYLIGKGVRL